MMKNLLFTILLVCIAVLPAGCAQKHIDQPSRRLPPPPTQLITQLYRTHTTHILKATARIVLQRSGKRYTQKIALAVKHPTLLRIEAIPRFGASDFFLAVNDDRLKVFLPGEKKFYIGIPTKENLFSFFNVYLSPADATALLTGTPSVTPGRNDSFAAFSDSEGYRIDLISDTTTVQSIWLDENHQTISKIQVSKTDGGSGYEVAFEDYLFEGATAYPQKISLIMDKPNDNRIDIRYTNLSVTFDNDTRLFDLAVPPGIVPTYLD